MRVMKKDEDGFFIIVIFCIKNKSERRENIFQYFENIGFYYNSQNERG